ncbi:PHP domain-containing protein [Virgisporangium ochraceum]|uniref:PHP domain-containing protein n=1 Tax=Virgisporangium ochraceum TaxID=65505 RepID=UPI00194573C0|nr:PHP domain-containing protein [Virgisporangium ochraceum]
MPLHPADSHVHSEWSWDARAGAMESTCARAVELGLPAIAFTEHLDHTVWIPEAIDDGFPVSLLAPDGSLTPPRFDAVGYLEAIERCRHLFPDLRILSGLEVGEPHRHADALAAVLAVGDFDRVLGSLHCLPVGDVYFEPPGLLRRMTAGDMVRRYLAEVARAVSGSHPFAVLAHVDYPFRYWTGPVDITPFEEEFRHALRATADSGRVLEVNSCLPSLQPTILRWWREEGGTAITIGSDAHEPDELARNFREVAATAEAHGFRPGQKLYEPWTHTG